MADRTEQLLDTSAIVVGYAMSRLDSAYLKAFKCRSWTTAFLQSGESLGVPPASLKNLRDEFDPIHPNARRGWHKRPLRAGRQRVMSELCEVSDDALIELVRRILNNDESVFHEVVSALARPSRRVHNVAERLLTGRLAEEYFLKHTNSIVGVKPSHIRDCRQLACGFDFSINSRPKVGIEIKGLKDSKGAVLFTDREWTEAAKRGENYWLVVVGNLSVDPVARLIRDPHKCIQASCHYQKSVSATWRASVTVA